MMVKMFFLKTKKIKVGVLLTETSVARNSSYGGFTLLVRKYPKFIQKVLRIFPLN